MTTTTKHYDFAPGGVRDGYLRPDAKPLTVLPEGDFIGNGFQKALVQMDPSAYYLVPFTPSPRPR